MNVNCRFGRKSFDSPNGIIRLRSCPKKRKFNLYLVRGICDFGWVVDMVASTGLTMDGALRTGVDVRSRVGAGFVTGGRWIDVDVSAIDPSGIGIVLIGRGFAVRVETGIGATLSRLLVIRCVEGGRLVFRALSCLDRQFPVSVGLVADCCLWLEEPVPDWLFRGCTACVAFDLPEFRCSKFDLRECCN